MSPSASRPLGTLITSVGVPGIEVSVFDGKLRRLEPVEGAGDLRWAVPRGLYKVRYQAGSAMDEKIVAVEDVSRPVHVPAPHLDFTSSVPLANTASTHEYHTAPAVDASRKAPVAIGAGATLFALIRSRGGSFARPSPAAGLTLVRGDGPPVIDFARTERDPGHTCAATHVEIDPGAYILRYECDAATLEQAIVVPAGWQTQLFISEAPEGSMSGLDLAGLGVLMARPGQGFDPSSPGLHAAELARKALRRGHAAMTPDQITLLLDAKHENPMLGIFAAHLLLLRPHRSQGVLESVIRRLEQLAPEHPDVACLRLALETETAVPVTSPPMLARSWDLLVEASTRRKVEINVPALAPVAGGLWDTGGAWLVWGQTKAAALDRAEAREGFAKGAIKTWLRRATLTLLAALAAEGSSHDRALSAIYRRRRPALEPILERLRAMSEPIGTALARRYGLSESEAAFINAVVLEYARKGVDAVSAGAVASRLRVPAPLIGVEAARIAKLLG